MPSAWNAGYEQADLIVPAVPLIAMLSDPAASAGLMVESLDYSAFTVRRTVAALTDGIK
jgi:hypothetical protein